MSADASLAQRMQRVEALLQRIERFANPAERETARELVQTLMDLHAAGLAALVERLRAASPPGQALVDACVQDPVIASLLLLHGLHPVDLATRILTALERVRPRLRAENGDVVFLGVAEGVVRLQLTGAGRLPQHVALVEEAVLALAPDAVAIEMEQDGQAPPWPSSRLVPLPVIRP